MSVRFCGNVTVVRGGRAGFSAAGSSHRSGLLENAVRLFALALACAAPMSALSSSEAAEAGAVFRSRCTGCHTFGQGVKVGPDLKGVTARRQRPWLISFIRSSSQAIRRGDPVAVSLFRQFNKERMPDWSDLSPRQIEAVLDYFAADGPAQKAPDDRHANTATAGEIEMGRWLFEGKIRFTSGAQACISCHTIHGGEGAFGGTFGPDLTSAYFQYQDKALTDLFKRPFSVHVVNAPARQLFTSVESFDLKAYMGRAAGLPIPAQMPGSSPGDASRVTAGARKASPVVR